MKNIQLLNSTAPIEKNLSQKVISGSIWMLSLQFISQAMTFMRLIVLARLLMPVDFGILGIGWVVIATLEAFSQTGISQALIQKKEPIDNFFNEAWTFLFLRGLVLYSVLFVAAPFVSEFFLQNSEGVAPIRWMGVLFIIQAVSSIGLVDIQRKMEFNKHFIQQFAANFVEVLVSITLVYVLRSIWAVVAGMIAGGCVGCLAGYLIHPFRPSFVLDIKKIRGLLSFGKWNTGSGICIFFGNNLDNILIGRMLGPMFMGLYQMAFKISNLPATEISYVLGRVVFPAYAKLQEKKDELKIAYFKVLKIIQLVTIPIGFLIVVMAHEFVEVYMGEKWLPMVPAMQLLAIGGILKSIVSSGTYLFLGSGRPEKDFYMQVFRVIILALTVYPFTYYYSMVGTSIAVISSLFCISVMWYVNISRMLSISFREYWKTLYPYLIGSGLMVVSVYYTKKILLFTANNMTISSFSFLAIVLVSLLCYFMTLLSLHFFIKSDVAIIDLGRIIRILINKKD